MSGRVPMAVIKAGLQDRLEDVLLRFGVDGPIRAGAMTPRNPTRADASPGSFVINVGGRRERGSFVDFAGGPQDRGDVLDLVAYLGGRPKDRAYAVGWALDFLGLRGGVDPGRLQRDRERIERQRRAREREAEEKATRQRHGAFAAWLKAEKAIAGTPVETYLARVRGIELGRLAHPPRALRYGPNEEYWLGRKTGASGRVESWGPKFPAMLAAMTDRHGQVVAVQRTFLTAIGEKAPVEKPKLIWPGSAGAVIRLDRGYSGLGPEEQARQGVITDLVLCEGIEDGLSLAMSLAGDEQRPMIWAVCGLANLARAPVDLACVGDVIVAADNDWQKPTAAAALEAALDQLEAQLGQPVGVMRSVVGKDFNDWIRAERETA